MFMKLKFLNHIHQKYLISIFLYFLGSILYSKTVGLEVQDAAKPYRSRQGCCCLVYTLLFIEYTPFAPFAYRAPYFSWPVGRIPLLPFYTLLNSFQSPTHFFSFYRETLVNGKIALPVIFPSSMKNELHEIALFTSITRTSIVFTQI